MSARQMLSSLGRIHVTHNTRFPFTEWEIVNLAKEAGLYLVDEETFYPWQYPGYVNKRGAGNCDESFRVGMSSTFKGTRCTRELAVMSAKLHCYRLFKV
ncbi:hypothetical protein RchiOBHm_Chr5g0024461 [Rosa chinensis]|uniref:25S rRNA (uridine-N(3))-methyltransferase BMT5-like domain-containing protein n=1 Tax=Rosa chinensis TaxID=74649 RepID=A0A2P6Q8B3_ROSCH|nr:hypothetical protein RchiOBHm_Chr5g0024461 [Rosa chinensis]